MVEKVAHDNGMSVGERDTEGLITPLDRGWPFFQTEGTVRGSVATQHGLSHNDNGLDKTATTWV